MRSAAAKDIRSNARQHWATLQNELRTGLLHRHDEEAGQDDGRNGQRLEEGAQSPFLTAPGVVTAWQAVARHQGDAAGHAADYIRPASHAGSASPDGAATVRSRRNSGQHSSFFERNFAVGSGAGFFSTPPSHDGDGQEVHPRGSAWWSPKTDFVAIYNLMTSSWINLLLVLVPLGALAKHLNWGPVAVFMLNFGGIVPLALVLGDVTEDLALRSGQIVGGLVNATCGNLVELIISLVALTKKSDAMNQVASMSNLGSILSNLLLVLGCCFFFGGLRYRLQKFNALANQVSNSLLFLAVIALVLPVAASHFPEIHIDQDSLLLFSRITGIVLMAAYAAYLYFQLNTHHDLFTAVEEDDEEAALTVTAELGVLFCLSVVVSLASENITDSIEDMSKKSGLNTGFLSLILLPIAGNAVEHITAVMVAVRNKMDLALGIAIGSSIQIALFVIPSCVLYSWAIDNPFTLDFNGLGTVAIVLAVIHANFITSGGTSHWLMGVQLICTYSLIATVCLYA